MSFRAIRSFLATLLMLLFLTLTANSQPIGIFDLAEDVGNVKIEGSSRFDPDSQSYTLEGSGYNIWFDHDEFHYLYKHISGDFILTANFELASQGDNNHRKTGWMIRGSMDDRSEHISAAIHGDGMTALQWRALRGAFMRNPEDQIVAPKINYDVLQLERQGAKVIFRAAHWGEPLQYLGSHEMESLPDSVLIGLFITSHDPDLSEQVRVWNVRIDKPVQNDYNPGRDGYLGCRLETLNVFNGTRKVIFEKNDRFEAPNWMPDGKKLLFNMDGFLYKIPLDGGELEQLNTGFANRNNNDHGISFDGNTLAISHHREGLPGGGSTVYVLPLEGGEPQLVTDKTPSYWHGWAPNNQEVVYVAQREQNNVYNIYRAAIGTGKETQITFFENGHVDGPEYSPDGNFIYYNGSQSGTMQLWRMKPDGTEKEQLTFDEYNDWFPHISPDGKWILYISFPAEIPVDSHPSYKRVMLRLMPVAGGASKVVAHLYGGQGTINVPSWSPDCRSVAFVSNSVRP